MNKELKPLVFWPPFIFILISAIYSLVDVDSFLELASQANTWILDHFSWAFAYGSFGMLLVVVAAYCSPLGKTKIGGESAMPLLSKWKWFSITLCTTIATGILFWTTAEPLYHFHSPSVTENIEPLSAEAYQFSMATMMMHWTLTPYGIYSCAGLLFALVYYNAKQPFSLASMLFPIFGKRVYGRGGDIINAICIYTLIAGMAASLGAGILTIRGGINLVFDYDGAAGMSSLIALTIVLTFIISAKSGLMKGIKILSDINIKILLVSLFLFYYLDRRLRYSMRFVKVLLGLVNLLFLEVLILVSENQIDGLRIGRFFIGRIGWLGRL